MNEDKEAVIRKVRKLLALADSSRNTQESEVNSALEMAHKMMRENDLEMSQVQLKKIEDEGALDKASTYRKNCVPWERSLAMAVANLTDTATYRSTQWDDGYKFSMRFIGVGADADFAAAAYDSLNETLRQMGKQSQYRGSEMQTFLLGIASRLQSRTRHMKEVKDAAIRKAEEAKIKAAEVAPTCENVGFKIEPTVVGTAPQYELMVLKGELVELKIKSMKMKNIKSGRMGGSRSSYEHGKRVGDTVNLNLNKQIE